MELEKSQYLKQDIFQGVEETWFGTFLKLSCCACFMLLLTFT